MTSLNLVCSQCSSLITGFHWCLLIILWVVVCSMLYNISCVIKKWAIPQLSPLPRTLCRLISATAKALAAYCCWLLNGVHHHFEMTGPWHKTYSNTNSSARGQQNFISQSQFSQTWIELTWGKTRVQLPSECHLSLSFSVDILYTCGRLAGMI